MIMVIDNVFDEEYLQQLTQECIGDLLQLDSSGPHVNEYSEYEWQMIKSQIRKSQTRYKLLETIGNYIGEQVPTEDLEPMQLFAKKFTKSSFIDPHKEDPTMYGDWVWMLSLTDENDGALHSNGVSVLPKRNRLAIMKTGTLHHVDPCSGDRLNLSGWPFATEQVRALWKQQPKQ